MSAKVKAILDTIVDQDTVLQTFNAIKTNYQLHNSNEIKLTIPGARDTYNPPMFTLQNGSYTFSYDDMDKTVCENWKTRFMSVYETLNIEKVRKLKEEALKLQVATMLEKLKSRKFQSQKTESDTHITITAIRN